MKLGLRGKTIVEVFNKVDMLDNKEMIKGLSRKYQNSVFVSAKKGFNVSGLMLKVKDILSKDAKITTIKLKQMITKV